MLSPNEVMDLLKSGEPLPQTRFGKLSDATAEAVLAAEPELVTAVLAAVVEGGDSEAVAMSGIERLCGQHHWYWACSGVAVAAAHRFNPVDVSDSLDVIGDETLALLKIFAVAAAHEDEDEGAWTVPMTMLASLSEEEVKDFAVCAIFCAAIRAMTGAAGR